MNRNRQVVHPFAYVSVNCCACSRSFALLSILLFRLYVANIAFYCYAAVIDAYMLVRSSLEQKQGPFPRRSRPKVLNLIADEPGHIWRLRDAITHWTRLSVSGRGGFKGHSEHFTFRAYNVYPKAPRSRRPITAIDISPKNLDKYPTSGTKKNPTAAFIGQESIEMKELPKSTSVTLLK